MNTRLLPLLTAFALGAAMTLSVASLADDKSKPGHKHNQGLTKTIANADQG